MQIVNNKTSIFQKTRSFVFWKKWVLANFIAELLGLGIITFVSTIVPTHDNQDSEVILILLGVFQGLISGFTQ